MNLKKILALVLALVMVLAFASCDTGVGDVDKHTGPVTQDKNLSEPGKEPIWIGEGTPSITIQMKKAENVTSYTENSYTKKLEADGNVKLVFDFLPPTDAELSIRTMMLAGTDLPMVLDFGLATGVGQDYADAGHLVDLDPYYESGITYYLIDNNESNPELYMLDTIRTAEGSFYGLPKYNAALSNETKYKLWINIEWLENLGTTRESIKNTDDFLAIMKRFRDEDPNQNGKKDEIPFMPTTSFGGTAFKFLTNAWVYEGENDLLMIKDGKVTVSYMQDEWYDAQAYIKNLVDEKILPSDGFTSNDSAVKAMLAAAGECIIGASTRSSTGYLKADTEHDYRLEFAALSPLTGPNGQCYAAYTRTDSQAYWHVTSAAGEYEQLCVRLGDVQQREDYYIQGRFGDEGTNWMKVDEYMEKVPNWDDLVTDAKDTYGIDLTRDMLKAIDPYATMGIKGEYMWFNDTWSDENANTWNDAAPTFSGVTESKGAQLEHTFQYEISNLYRQCEATIDQQNLMRSSDLVCPPLSFTDEETTELSLIQAGLRKYVSEQRVAYYTGNNNELAKGKDVFLKECNAQGLDKMLEIMNTAYQRAYGN